MQRPVNHARTLTGSKFVEWQHTDDRVYHVSVKPLNRLIGRSTGILSPSQTDVRDVSVANPWDGLSVSLALRFCSLNNIRQLRRDAENENLSAEKRHEAMGLSLYLEQLRSIYKVLLSRKPLKTEEEVKDYFVRSSAVVERFRTNLDRYEVRNNDQLLQL